MKDLTQRKHGDVNDTFDEVLKAQMNTEVIEDVIPVGNLDLWDRVQETNPNYTKKANVKGNQITSIAPQFQIMNATEQFGAYGSKWGFKDMWFDYSLKELGLICLNATFFFPNGSFPVVNSISLWRDNAQTKIDDQFAKKLETDALTKALSKLGFNADIFLGRFDDSRYFNEVNEKYNPKPKKTISDADFSRGLEKMGAAKFKTFLNNYEMTAVQNELLQQLLNY